MEPLTYAEALAYIDGLAKRGWRLGLDRMEEFLRRADLLRAVRGPEAPKFLHVAGTNGKGSVTAYLQSILVESGYESGSYFSPFVFDPRERIQYNRRLIPKHLLALWTTVLRPFAESLADTEYGGASEFEFKTAIGFAFWQHLQCEAVALEVGLGGRLDATNVIDPAACGIVSIGLDHMAILGDTLELIAAEKAGVIKPGKPVVVGEMEEGPRKVILDRAQEVGASGWVMGREVTYEVRPSGVTVRTPSATHAGLQPGIYGERQPHNLAVAVAMMDAAGMTRTLRGLTEGARKAFAPGRFQVVESGEQTFVLDGAHNEASCRVLAETLRQWKKGQKTVWVAGMVAGHDPEPVFRAMKDVVDEVVLVPIQNPRAVDPSTLVPAVTATFNSVEVRNDLAEGLAVGREKAGKGGVVLVAGSFYLVGECGVHLGLVTNEEETHD
ncbi:MAG: hypothetical protein JST35_03225 [Armatimonadetes bacterium]|nr:hypothetical protein [Armatimonadota bacterium]